MDARLEIMAGPLKGRTLTLTEHEISIGRHLSCKVCLKDLSASRRHCLIQLRDGRYFIQDLESQNGTFVNAVPIRDRPLDHGDEIRVGNSVFLFLTSAKGTGRYIGPSNATLGLETEHTVRLRPKDAVYLQPQKVLQAGSPTARVAHDLSAVVRAASVVHSVRGLGALTQRLLEIILEVTEAERGAILLREPDSDELNPVSSLDQRSRDTKPFTISNTVVQRSYREGLAVLIEDMSQPSVNVSETLLASPTQSVIAVPLSCMDQRLGMIYVDTSNSRTRLDEGHLQLVTAIAAHASIAIDNARHLEWLETQVQQAAQRNTLLIGESQPLQSVRRLLAKVGPTASTVLIEGESGTGKELAARSIHLGSPRKDRPFVAVNCATLTDSLLESELFGHERGAFTGAVAQKKGKMELADGGTIFLDEIGELAPNLQAKLLRVLQQREIERVGGTRTIKIDVRVVAATNKDLKQAISTGAFREDLYFRLNVFKIQMPALHDRPEDIPLLANFFAAKFGQGMSRPIQGISPAAREVLVNYNWPGNVRELENAIERAVVLCSSDVILPEDLPESMVEADQPGGVAVTEYHEAVKQFKKDLVLKAVSEADYNYTKAAKRLGLHPNNLHRLIRNLNLKAALKTAVD